MTESNLHQHMATCQQLQQDFGEIYQQLGRCHEQIMNKPVESSKKISALNLKSLILIFTKELDSIIAGAPQPV